MCHSHGHFIQLSGFPYLARLVVNLEWLLETAWQLLHKDFGAKFKLGPETLTQLSFELQARHDVSLKVIYTSEKPKVAFTEDLERADFSSKQQ